MTANSWKRSTQGVPGGVGEAPEGGAAAAEGVEEGHLSALIACTDTLSIKLP